MCNGLPLWHGAQLAVDTTCVSPVTPCQRPTCLVPKLLQIACPRIFFNFFTSNEVHAEVNRNDLGFSTLPPVELPELRQALLHMRSRRSGDAAGLVLEMFKLGCVDFFFLRALFCDSFRRGPSATANYSTRRVRDLSPRWQAAGSRCIQPSRVLQDLVHSRRAGSRGDCVKRELEQRAGEGPLRSCGNDAAPAGHVGCTQGRADGSVRARSARLCKEPQEGRGFRAPAATNLDGENHKVAALRARQLGVGVATLAPCCELKREAGSGVGALPRLNPEIAPRSM